MVGKKAFKLLRTSLTEGRQGSYSGWTTVSLVAEVERLRARNFDPYADPYVDGCRWVWWVPAGVV